MRNGLKKIFFSLMLGISLSQSEAQEFVNEGQALQVIQAHLLVKDEEAAFDVAQQALKQFPQSKRIWKMAIRSLAASGREKLMLQVWKSYTELFPVEQHDEVLEEMSWAVIQNGSSSSAPIIRVMSLLAAYFGQDSRGVAIIHDRLYDKNALVRSIAAQISGTMRDDILKDDVISLLQTEKNWDVRLALIEAVAGAQIVEAKPYLLRIISQKESWDAEKQAAVEALVQLAEKPTRRQIEHLCQSSKSGMRILACELVHQFDSQENIDLIADLVKDYHCQVRTHAIETLGVLRASQYADLIKNCLADRDSEVAIKAAWATTLFEPKAGQRALQKWLMPSHKLEDQLLAAAALNACGKYGSPLNIQAFHAAKDPFLKLNLAYGLILQRQEIELAGRWIHYSMAQDARRWMWKEKGIFRYIAQSDVRQHDIIPNYPEAVNQITRLELLNLLSIVKHPLAQKSLEDFLQHRTWGISSLASIVLLSEGDDQAVDLLRQLLAHAEASIKVQTALILAQWGEDEQALETLELAYPQADREMKEKILEGMLKVASPKSISFLTERLAEPSPSLRVIAAAALLNCLNH